MKELLTISINYLLGFHVILAISCSNIGIIYKKFTKNVIYLSPIREKSQKIE